MHALTFKGTSVPKFFLTLLDNGACSKACHVKSHFLPTSNFHLHAISMAQLRVSARTVLVFVCLLLLDARKRCTVRLLDSGGLKLFFERQRNAKLSGLDCSKNQCVMNHGFLPQSDTRMSLPSALRLERDHRLAAARKQAFKASVEAFSICDNFRTSGQFDLSACRQPIFRLVFNTIVVSIRNVSLSQRNMTISRIKINVLPPGQSLAQEMQTISCSDMHQEFPLLLPISPCCMIGRWRASKQLLLLAKLQAFQSFFLSQLSLLVRSYSML